MTVDWLADFTAESVQGYVLCDDSLGGSSCLFWGLDEALLLRPGDHVSAWWAQVQAAQNNDRYLAGGFAYDFSACLDAPLACRDGHDGVLAGFGVFRHAQTLNAAQVVALLEVLCATETAGYHLRHHRFSISAHDYIECLAKIARHIADGDTYQVNFTFRLEADFNGNRLGLYWDLREVQPVAYGAVVSLPGFFALSCSPELFFRKTGAEIVTKPMKGTLERSQEMQRKVVHLSAILRDPKSQAENVMIVDLLRNDLGRIAAPGSVEVESLFDIETYPTLYQMTSTIKARVATDISVGEIVQQIFPSGSITGAPKKRTMEIIANLETTPRGLYTGAVGYVLPNNDMCFNVAIRTLTFTEDSVTMGIGGGIVADSESLAEYREALLKARFLFSLGVDFHLIETLKLEHGGGAMRWGDHRARMMASARLLNFPLNVAALDHAVANVQQGMSVAVMALRVTLSPQGGIATILRPLPSIPDTPRWADIATFPIDSRWLWLSVKSTERALYDQEYALAQQAGLYERLFVNERGVLSEACRHNLFIRRGARYYTPPITAGLLPGVMRAHLIKEWDAEESDLVVQDLIEADEILLCNALRGAVSVRLRRAEE